MRRVQDRGSAAQLLHADADSKRAVVLLLQGAPERPPERGHHANLHKLAAAVSAGTAESDPVAASLNYNGQVSGNATVILKRHKRRTRKSQEYELRVKPDEQNFSHMEFSNVQLSNTRPASHPSITLNATINSVIYSKVNARAPKAAPEQSRPS